MDTPSPPPQLHTHTNPFSALCLRIYFQYKKVALISCICPLFNVLSKCTESGHMTVSWPRLKNCVLQLNNNRLPTQANLLSMVKQGNRSALTTTIRGYTGSTLNPIGPRAEGSHAGVVYYRLFKYTQQHTACFKENNIGPHTSEVQPWVIVFKYHVNNHSYINLKEEMRGIPGKDVNVKGIYLGRGMNHIDRTVCCLGVGKWRHGICLSYKNSLKA